MAVRWVLLIGLSLAVSVSFKALGVPAALFLGPLAASIIVAVSLGPVRVAPPLLVPAQGLLGCMIVQMLPTTLSAATIADWPVLLVGVVGVVLASTAIGWLVTRWRLMPGTTAIWGLSPGGATVMTLMSEGFGADPRLVAFMQYGRLILVAVSSSALAQILGGTPGGTVTAAPSIVLFPPINGINLTATLALAIMAPLIGIKLRIPAGGFLVPIIAGIALVRLGWITLELPLWLLGAAYFLLAWQIGLRFTRPLLMHAVRLLPAVILSIVALLAVCAALGATFSLTLGIDPLTAYLATSPGGADTAAIIAASTPVDMPFVMTMQLARLVVVMVVGPVLARLTTRWASVPVARRP